MTLRHISTATGSTTDAVVKAWKLLPFGNHPGLDATLPKEQAETLLSRLALPTTRRTPEAAQAAATLLAEFRAGMHQNGHMEPTKARTIAPMPKPTRRTTKQPAYQPVQPAQKRLKWPVITALDIVYASTILTACYGLWFTLKEMGVMFAVPYVLVSYHAMKMAKNPDSRKTAQAGIAAVVILEILTFFVHLVLFNLRAVQAAKAGVLPFEYSFYGSLSMPFTIACILAGLFSAAGIYAVAVTFSLTSEKHTLAEKAKQETEQKAKHVAELRAALEDAIWELGVISMQKDFNVEKAGVMAGKYSQILNETKQND